MTAHTRQAPIIVAIVGVTAALAAVLWFRPAIPTATDEHGHAEDAFERGPHGGRVLRDGDFALEVTIFERGMPAEFRVYASRGDEALAPEEVELTIELARLGGRVDRVGFSPRRDHLAGDREVEEPHSFDVTVTAREGGREHRFAYDSYEARVTLTSDAAADSGIEIAEAAPARIQTTLPLNGRIVPNEDALAHIMPPFPGVAKRVSKRLGDPVAVGDLLAVIESNQSLYLYDVRSSLAGTVLFKEITPGEFVSSDREIYVIGDLSTVWADLQVYRHDFAKLRVGQRVWLDAGDGTPPLESTISYLSPVGATNTQTLLARAVIVNPEGLWRPGLFVAATVEVDEVRVPVAVRVEALQRMRDWDVVFRNDGDVFEAQPVELGRRGHEWVEIRSGLAAGDRYVARQSFLLKADVGKSGASHDH